MKKAFIVAAAATAAFSSPSFAQAPSDPGSLIRRRRRSSAACGAHGAAKPRAHSTTGGDALSSDRRRVGARRSPIAGTKKPAGVARGGQSMLPKANRRRVVDAPAVISACRSVITDWRS